MLISPFFILFSLIWFLIGAAVGSFINVIIFRSVTGEQWVAGRSHCDFCQQELAWFDNIPLLSFFVLKGKSRCCGRELSISHPVIEVLTGSLFVWWYWGWSFFFHLTQTPFRVLQLTFWLAVGIILLMIVVIDFAYMVIPDELVGLLVLLALAYRVVLTAGGIMEGMDFIYLLVSAVAASAALGALWLGTKGKGIGLGDVKLAAPLALLVGWPNILVALFMSFMVGAVVGVGLLATGQAKLGQPIPFGPFLVIGTLIALVFGTDLITWYVSLL